MNDGLENLRRRLRIGRLALVSNAPVKPRLKPSATATGNTGSDAQADRGAMRPQRRAIGAAAADLDSEQFRSAP
jgi:hypothetical protein